MSDQLPQPGLYPPGIYQGVGFDIYRTWPLMNATTLCWGYKSMEHLRAAQQGLLGHDSAALNFGRALHVRLLEPDLYAERYKISTPCIGLLASGQRQGEECGLTASMLHDGLWYCKKHSPNDAVEATDYLSPAEGQQVEAACLKVRQHQVVKLIRQHGGFEASVVWEAEGVLMKSRLDKLIVDAPTRCPDTILDLKKVQVGRGDDDSFAQAIKRYHYHTKAAMYVDAIEQIAGKRPHFIWIVVEDNYPFSVNVIRADKETLAIGRGQYRQLLQNYKLCLAADRWPGYASDITTGGLPAGYIREHSQFME